MNRENKKKGMHSRRDFLIRLGAGTTLAIAGFFTFDVIKTVINKDQEKVSDMPKLSENIKKYYENNQIVLLGEDVKCSMNEMGAKIVELLDGKNSLSRIASKISDHYAIKDTDALEVSIATFLCQLSILGFLSSLYYVTLYETN